MAFKESCFRGVEGYYSIFVILFLNDIYDQERVKMLNRDGFGFMLTLNLCLLKCIPESP